MSGVGGKESRHGESVDLSELDIEEDARAMLPADSARQHRCVPLSALTSIPSGGTVLVVAMSDPSNWHAIVECDSFFGIRCGMIQCGWRFDRVVFGPYTTIVDLLMQI